MSAPLTPPRMLYGCAWKKLRTRELVVKAILAGFRGIDVATQPKHYNQTGVGDALKELTSKHGIARSSLFLQTKFTSLDGQDLSQPLPYDVNAPLAEQVQQSLATALRELATNYIDSLVMHSPMRSFADTMVVWREFESFVDAGTVHRIGLSNCYDPKMLQRLINQARIKPWVLQNRFVRESDYDRANLKICFANDITYQSFWTLSGNPHLLRHSSLLAIASALNYTPQQALYRFLMAPPWRLLPLNGTTSDTHMTQDLALLIDDRHLPSEHVRALANQIWPGGL